MPDVDTIESFFRATISLGTPLIFAVLGGVFLERTGVFAIGLEGMMLLGAFSGAAGGLYSGNLWFGVVAGAAGGIAIAFLMGVVSVFPWRANQIVVALALNLLALGVTGFLASRVFAEAGIGRLIVTKPVAVPILSGIPIVGAGLFVQPVLTYLAYVGVLAGTYVLYRTRWGLNIRAVGDDPRACDAVGINPWKMRYAALVACGGFAGIGGAALAVQLVGHFAEGMTRGRGFIALAAVIFGRWNPAWASGAVLVFAGAEAANVRIQAHGTGIPAHFTLMLPYLAALAGLAGLRGRGSARYPRAMGHAYVREE